MVGGDPAVPFAIIAPVIVVICAIGVHSHNNMFDVYMMVVFGILGYLFKKLMPARRWCSRWCWAT